MPSNLVSETPSLLAAQKINNEGWKVESKNNQTCSMRNDLYHRGWGNAVVPRVRDGGGSPVKEKRG